MMSLAGLFKRKGVWLQLAQELSMELLEGAPSVEVYDRASIAIHGEQAALAPDLQAKLQATAELAQGLSAQAERQSPFLGLLVATLVPSGLAIRGEVEGVSVAIVPDHLAVSSRKDDELCLMAFRNRPLDLGLELAPEGMLFRFVKRLSGAQDIVVGHADLDRAAIIRGRAEGPVRTLLSRPEVAAPLVSLAARYRRWLVNDAMAYVVLPTSSVTGKTAGEALAALAGVVRALDA